jgi:hypothetical protein
MFSITIGDHPVHSVETMEEAYAFIEAAGGNLPQKDPRAVDWTIFEHVGGSLHLVELRRIVDDSV